MKLPCTVYNIIKLLPHSVCITLAVLLTTSCTHTTFDTLTGERKNQLTVQTNALRAANGLPPLVLSAELSDTASNRAKLAATGAASAPPLQRLIEQGVFARFALSNEIAAPSADAAWQQLFSNPLYAGKLQHNGISHIGFGQSSAHGKTFLVVDMARLVEKVDPELLAKELEAQINRNRQRIGVAAIETHPGLTAAAMKMNAGFMTAPAQKALLLETVRGELASEQMTLGKITIAFQTASVKEELVLPERTSDPGARYFGIAVAQGNVEQQDPGAFIVTIILATPAQDAMASMNGPSRPSPKAMPDGHKPNTRASLEEQAWLATLVGNHKKAATQFEKTWRQQKKPELLYEAARAFARNGDMKTALEKMKQYAKLCEAECTSEQKQNAAAMVQKLEAGESIFATSKEAQYTVEAKRFFILGQKLFGDGEWEGAIDAFSQAYAYAPHPDLLYNIGQAHLRAGNVGDALDFFQEYQRQVPEAQSADQAKQLFEMGVELYNVGQYDAAARRFTMAYSALPIDEILFNLALCHQQLGERQDALRILQQLADKTTDSVQKKEYKKLIQELNP